MRHHDGNLKHDIYNLIEEYDHIYPITYQEYLNHIIVEFISPSSFVLTIKLTNKNTAIDDLKYKIDSDIILGEEYTYQKFNRYSDSHRKIIKHT